MAMTNYDLIKEYVGRFDSVGGVVLEPTMTHPELVMMLREFLGEVKALEERLYSALDDKPGTP